MQQKLRLSDKIILFPLWLITLLPLRILFVISDFFFLILLYVVGYRKRVVTDNLQKAFPEKSMQEIIKIRRRFYRYLCDYFIESVYMINMGARESKRRYHFENIEMLNKLHQEGKSIILAVVHYGNWEWATNVTLCSEYTLYGVYKPQKNKIIDRLFIQIRSKFNSIPVPYKQTLRTITTKLSNKEPIILCLVGDQRPRKSDLEYWSYFLNQETPIITGMDKLARKLDLPVVFMNIQRVKRGYYHIKFEMIEDKSKLAKPYEIIERYIKKVEDMIHMQPEYWLWSHKRFKYKPEEYKIIKGS